MDEEEIEGLLPRTDLDNASQQSVSTEDVMLGGAGLGAIGFYNQTGRMPSPVINKSSPVTPTFQPPAVQGPSTVTTTQPTTLTTTKPTALTTTRPTTLTTTPPPRGTPNYTINYGSAARTPGLIKGAGIGTLLYGAADYLTEKATGRGISQRIGEDFLAPKIGADVFQNAEAIDKSMKLQADFRNETQRLKELEAQKALEDRAGVNFQVGGLDSPNQMSDEEIRAQREQRMFDQGNQFEAAYQLPDGTFEGRLRGGGKRIMTPEELEAMEYSQTIGNPAEGQPPLGEYQDVPGTDGSVRLPMAPSPVAEQPAVSEFSPVVSEFTPEEQSLIDNNPFLPPEGETSTPVVNDRPITMADANNPAFEGMSAAEIVEAVNAPGYESPDSFSVNAPEQELSRFQKMGEGALLFGDTLAGAGKVLLSPFVTAKNYLMGTPGNPNPSFPEAISATGEFLEGNEITDRLSADEDVQRMAEEQDARNARFLREDPGVEYRDGVQIVDSRPLTPEERDNFMGAEGSPQRFFVDRIQEGPLSPEEIQRGYDFAEREGFNFDPNSGFSKRSDTVDVTFRRDGTRPLPVSDTGFPSRNPPKSDILTSYIRDDRQFFPDLSGGSFPGRDIPAGLQDLIDRINRDRGVGEVRNLPSRPGDVISMPLQRDGRMSPTQFMRYEDNPANRTEQFVDPQGRIRRRLTPMASALQGNPLGVQPLAPEYASYERDAADRDARVRAADAQRAQSTTSGGVRDRQLGYSDSDLTKIFGRGKRLQRAKALAQNGIDPVTMKPVSETASDARQDSLRERILEAEAIAKEKGEDPAEVRNRILNNQLLEERIAELRRKGLPEDITFRKGEFGTIVVQKGGRDISYFKESVDLEEQLARAGYFKNDTMNATGDNKNIPKAAIDTLKDNPETRDQFDSKYGAGASDKILGAEGSTRD